METKEELELLQAEILNLFNYIQRVRKEVAAITRSDEGNGRFDNMSDQLDAIVQATEDATNSIMEVVEQDAETIQEIRGKTEDPEILGLLDRLDNNQSNIFQACTFQDITGQRVTKIARSVTYVESRVNSLIEIFGKEHLENVEVEVEEDGAAERDGRGQLRKGRRLLRCREGRGRGLRRRGLARSEDQQHGA